MTQYPITLFLFFFFFGMLSDALYGHAGKGCCGGGSQGASHSSAAKTEKKPYNPSSARVNFREKKSSSSHVQSSSKKKQSWWSSKKTLNTMNYQELKEAKERYLTEKNIPSAIKFLERMVKECTDLNERRTLLLELADLLFETGQFDQAGDLYKEFAKYYSGSDKVEYATYKAIVCSYKYIADIDRDQTKTIETIELAQAFLDRSNIFKVHIDDVQTIFAACMQRLFESELCIADFYIHRGRYVSAVKRIETIRKNFISCVPTAEPQILTMECALAEKLNDSALSLAKQSELKQKFPDYNNVVITQNLKSKTHTFANRF